MRPFILTTAFFVISHCCSYPQPVVNTRSGSVTGREISFENISVFTFQSIPFAKPPIGKHRFKKPVPIDAWSEPLQATHKPPGCIQYSPNPFIWLDNLPGLTEDCLYLNIWTPMGASENNKKSVLFFIHGGGFRISSSRLDYYDGTVLAALGDVVVVTTNYRLGPMGFLYSGTDDAPGNMGLYDILEALKWVHSNIEFFGGCKESITLIGQSSGAIAIGMFMTSPLFEGLFARAIMDSGSAANLDAEDNEKDFKLTQALAKEFGCAKGDDSLQNEPAEVIRCLREVDGLELSKTVGKLSDDPQRSLYPRYGDELLPSNARRSFLEGNFAPMDVLIGVNSEEGSMMITKARTDVFGFFGQKNPQINKTFGEQLLKTNFKKFPNHPDIVAKHYLSSLKEVEYSAIRYQVAAASGDYARVCPSVYLAETISNKGNKVYFYLFHHRSSVSPYASWMGVVHFDEIPFVFGYPLTRKQDFTAAELTLSRHMVKIWTNFAKTGYPGLRTWPLYTNQSHDLFVLQAEGSHIQSGPHLKNCNFFRGYFGF